MRTKFDIYVFIIQTYIQSLEAVKELHHLFNLLELPRDFNFVSSVNLDFFFNLAALSFFLIAS